MLALLGIRFIFTAKVSFGGNVHATLSARNGGLNSLIPVSPPLKSSGTLKIVQTVHSRRVRSQRHHRQPDSAKAQW